MSKLKKIIAKFCARPPEARFDDVKYVLEALGFKEVRSSGSHHSFRREEGKMLIVVPKKGGQLVKGTYIRQIVEALKLEDGTDE